MILFGHMPDDRQIYSTNHNGEPLFTSPTIEKIWGKGYVDVGNVTYESAAYVARYIMKKINGPQSAEHYEHVTRYGELVNLEPEYTDMSRDGGIGKMWIEDYHQEVYPSDSIVVKRNGKYIETKPPIYYDKVFNEINPELMEQIKEERLLKGFNSEHNQPARLRAKQTIAEKRLKLLKRKL